MKKLLLIIPLTIYLLIIFINTTSSSVFSENCSIYSHEDDFEVHCRGANLNKIPKTLNQSLNRLIISETKMISTIFFNSFNCYQEKLQDIVLTELPNLRVIEDGTFANISKLRTISIYNAPQLKFIYGLLKGVTSLNFRTLRIVNTGLMEVPNFSNLPQENTLFLLDLDHNKIEILYKNSIKVSAQQVTLNFNNIHSIENYAFNGSEIGKLHINGNSALKFIGENAFVGLKNLRELDLTQSALKTLPYNGLKNLEILKIRDTPSLNTIPSLYDLQSLKIALLTHHFHCCAFKYPKEHSPEKHAEYEENMRQICVKSQKSDENRRKRSSNMNNNNNNNDEDYRTPLQPLKGQFIKNEKPRYFEEILKDTDDDDGIFHKTPTIINETSIEIFCGNITFKLQNVQCYPIPNALNPCEDIMGITWLRNTVWFVVILAVFGNFAVISVILFSPSEINVSRFLICNLAFADLCMGLYLLLIAIMDLYSVGTYFNFAFNWQYGIGCEIAGFLTVFAGHLSIFTLTIITFERWFAIKFAINLTRRIRLNSAIQIMIIGWIYSILMGILPLFRISNYSSTSICLPMEIKSIFDTIYLYTIFVLNGFSLFLIVFCYAQIYLSLGYETRRATIKGEMTIAKKFALLIFVDFATYTPIAFFGLCALIGYPLINITKSKILLVFFYPLNACANPYLYALMTEQYRKDFFIILSRCGCCKRKVLKYSQQREEIPLTIPFTLK